MGRTVFFSWQSNRSSREGRNLIERALEIAVTRIASDMTVEEALREGLTVDKDTKNVPGSPPIFQTILRKIDEASVFVADLTICGTCCDGDPTPNPNVLIEFGWALKAKGYSQVLAVMNAAHGEPSAASMPFDLASYRFPITYNLPDGASGDERNKEREQLANTFEKALRGIFESDEFKATLPKPPEPAPFPLREPMDGKARFRRRNVPIGFVRDVMGQLLGTPQAHPIYLADGPAIWLRLMPAYAPDRTWLNQELKGPSLPLVLLPLMHHTRNIGFLEDDDGCGHYWLSENRHTISVSYVFNTGELWIINACLSRVKDFMELDENAFTRTLEGAAAFLVQLGCEMPFRWAVGMEGVKGRKLVIANRHPSPPAGPCFADLIEDEGIYEEGSDAAKLLRPFFEKVFDKCGIRRMPNS
jgi:hypothetical protein